MTWTRLKSQLILLTCKNELIQLHSNTINMQRKQIQLHKEKDEVIKQYKKRDEVIKQYQERDEVKIHI